MKKVTKTASKKATRPNPFNGAKDIYLTKNKIAVTSVDSARTERGYSLTKKVRYYSRNPRNMKQLKAAQGDVVRVGRKGNNYVKI